MKRVALVVLDAQIGFLADPGLTPRRDALVARIGDWLRHFRAEGLPIAHVRTVVRTDGSDCMPHWRRRSPIPCTEGSADAAADPTLVELPGEGVFRKRLYSAFGDPGLARWIESRAISDLVVAGVHTHACVLATCLDALPRGIGVWIDREAVGSYDPAHAALALAWMDGRVARCASREALLALLPRRQTGLRRLPAELAAWQHTDPCDGVTVLDEVPLQSAEQIDRAICGLLSSSGAEAQTPRTELRGALRRWATALEADAEQIARQVCRQVGKPLRDARGEVEYGLALLRSAAMESPEPDDAAAGVHFRPGGLTAVITAWNNPVATAIGKIAPALACGNTVAWKPALAGSAVARSLVASLGAAGLGGRIVLLEGDARTALALADHPAVERLSFTGSIAAGRALAVRCAARMLPFQGELGGNNAAIVLGDADLDAVVADLVPAMFSFAGQRCTAIRRIIVEVAVHDALASRLARAVEALTTELPDHPRAILGPVIARDKQAALLQGVERSCLAGGRLLARGAVAAGLPPGGFWLPAMLLQDLEASDPLVAEEQFGPVVVIEAAVGLQAALERLNASGHGLLAALYSEDPQAQRCFATRARAGILSINRARPDFKPDLPFGGWGLSGYGPPEHGRWARDFGTRPQALYALDDRVHDGRVHDGQAHPPAEQGSARASSGESG